MRSIHLLMVLAVLVGACGDDDAVTTTASVPATTTVTTAPTTTSITGVTTTSTTTVPTTTTTAPPTTTTTTAATTTTTTTTTIPADNHAPVVVIDSPANFSTHSAYYFPGAAKYGALVGMTGTVSDPDGDAVTVEWFSSDQGLLGTHEDISVVLYIPGGDAAQPFLTLRATDAWGAVSEASVQIIVVVWSDV